MADAPLKAREGGECDLQINSPYRALWSLSVGNVAGKEISDPALNSFWAKAESLGILAFIHPQGDGAPSQLGHRFRGNGYLSNVIGNPLETSIALSHLIFDGTLDRYPGIKICAAHGGGYLPSYAARSDLGCKVRPDLCHGGTWGPIKKRPTEYLRQMLFSEEGLRHLVAEVGADRLMIGTDYPYPWTSTSVEHVLDSPHLSDAQKAAILGGTAATLLGIARLRSAARSRGYRVGIKSLLTMSHQIASSSKVRPCVGVVNRRPYTEADMLKIAGS